MNERILFRSSSASAVEKHVECDYGHAIRRMQNNRHREIETITKGKKRMNRRLSEMSFVQLVRSATLFRVVSYVSCLF